MILCCRKRFDFVILFMEPSGALSSPNPKNKKKSTLKKKFLLFREMELSNSNIKKIPYIFSKESFSYIFSKENLSYMHFPFQPPPPPPPQKKFLKFLELSSPNIENILIFSYIFKNGTF